VTDLDDGDAPGSTPFDPDNQPEAPAQRRTPVAGVLAAIAVGGVLGAEARYGLGVAIPHAAGHQRVRMPADRRAHAILAASI
jgi:hypothetical protein